MTNYGQTKIKKLKTKNGKKRKKKDPQYYVKSLQSVKICKR